MTAETPAYNPLYVRAWSILTIVVCLVFLGMFVFGPQLIHAGRAVWDLLRWICTPII